MQNPAAMNNLILLSNRVSYQSKFTFVVVVVVVVVVVIVTVWHCCFFRRTVRVKVFGCCSCCCCSTLLPLMDCNNEITSRVFSAINNVAPRNEQSSCS